MLILGRCFIAVACVCVSGCTTFSTFTDAWDRNLGAYKANTAELDPDNAAKFQKKDDQLAAGFAHIEEKDVGSPRDWRPAVYEGINYAHQRCTNYLEATFFFNRVRNTSSREIHTASAGTSALLALIKASRELAGILPLGFDFVDQTVNNVGQGLLYDLDPAIVMGLVTKSQADFRASIEHEEFKTQGEAMIAIRSYAELCLPISIEADVKQTLAEKGAPPQPPPSKSQAQAAKGKKGRQK